MSSMPAGVFLFEVEHWPRHAFDGTISSLSADEIRLVRNYRRMDHGDKEYFVLCANILVKNPASGVLRILSLLLIAGGAA